MENRKILCIIFLSSLSSLGYEILLTRIFSISLWYHFAFMIISIAMLGIGASGTIISLYPKLKDLSNIGIYTLLLGIWISLSYILSNQIPFDPVELSWSSLQIFNISLYYITLSIPFFFAGLIVATAFSSISGKAGLIYFADLLGAGTGSIGILYVLIMTQPENGVFILSAVALIGAYLKTSKILKFNALILIIINFIIIFNQPDFVKPRMSPYKDLKTAMRYPGAEHIKTYFSPFSRVDIFKSPAVRFAPGLSLKYFDPLPEQIGLSIDGGALNAITNFNGKRLSFLEYMPSAIPYFVGSNDDVLIIDPKGGLHALSAKYFGSKNIYNIESNPLVTKIIKNDYADFSGNIFGDKALSGIGRSWLKSSDKKFDIIDISLMGAAPSGSLGISEDYRFTVEAFREYIAHLKTNGLLNISLFIFPPPKTELRLLNTIVTVLEGIGIKDTGDHIAAIRSWGSICLLVKKTPFNISEIAAIRNFSKQKRFDLIHCPGIKEEETNIYVRMLSNEYFSAFKNIINPVMRKDFVEKYIFDIKPVHDENPFFHYYLRFENIRATYKIMGKKWQYFIEEGYLLSAAFLQVLFFSLLIIFIPAFSKHRDREYHSDIWLLSYFIFLGIGFMFIEISLIQKIILPLENPSYAVASLLTSILISSGVGSLLSYRIRILRTPRITIFISVAAALYGVFLPQIMDYITVYPLPVKIIAVFLIFLPLGILMGIPFPTGLKILGRRNESLIPWAWAINGCFSVLAPILAVMLSIKFGFRTVLWSGAAAYFLASIVFSFQPPRPLEQTPQDPSA